MCWPCFHRVPNLIFIIYLEESGLLLAGLAAVITVVDKLDGSLRYRGRPDYDAFRRQCVLLDGN
jgi:hypothetical protein